MLFRIRKFLCILDNRIVIQQLLAILKEAICLVPYSSITPIDHVDVDYFRLILIIVPLWLLRRLCGYKEHYDWYILLPYLSVHISTFGIDS